MYTLAFTCTFGTPKVLNNENSGAQTPKNPVLYKVENYISISYLLGSPVAFKLVPGSLQIFSLEFTSYLELQGVPIDKIDDQHYLATKRKNLFLRFACRISCGQS